MAKLGNRAAVLMKQNSMVHTQQVNNVKANNSSQRYSSNLEEKVGWSFETVETVPELSLIPVSAS